MSRSVSSMFVPPSVSGLLSVGGRLRPRVPPVESAGLSSRPPTVLTKPHSFSDRQPRPLSGAHHNGRPPPISVGVFQSQLVGASVGEDRAGDVAVLYLAVHIGPSQTRGNLLSNWH